MRKETGGQAFPRSGKEEVPVQGMTLRDYFAAKAMASLLSNWDESADFPCGIDASPRSDDDNMSQCGFMVRASYIYADAMLAGRTK